MTYTIRDPFAGELDVVGDTLAEAIKEAYADIEPRERPTHCWHEDKQIDIPGGLSKPNF